MSFTVAIGVYQLAQLVWLLLVTRTMSAPRLAALLAALAIFSLLFLVVDNGPAYLGARRAAVGALDAAERASLIRLRLQLALAGAILGTVVSLSGGRATVVAFAPYAVALVLIGALNTWERWGRGDPTPISCWIGIRGLSLVIVTGSVLAAGMQLPLWAPGLLECASVVAASLLFRLGLVRSVRAGLGARPGPWRSAARIGLPALLGQLMLSSGVILLNAKGPPVAAAVFAVGVRIVSGLNNGAGLLSGSLFPRLAGAARAEAAASEQGARLMRFMMLSIVAIGSAGTAGACVANRAIVTAFLGSGHAADSGALIAILSVTTAAGSVLSMGAVLIARGQEDGVFRSTLAGVMLVLSAGVIVAALSPPRIATWMGVCLMAGQVLTTGLLLASATQLTTAERMSLCYSVAASMLACLIVVPALIVPRAATVCGLAEALLSAVALAAAVRVAAAARSAGHRLAGRSLCDSDGSVTRARQC